MGRKIFTYILLAVLSAGPPAAAQRYVISPRNGTYAVSEEKLRAGVELLADPLCTGRGVGAPGAGWAKAWIREQFRRLDLVPFDSTYVHGFAVADSLKGHNLIGMVPGTSREGRPYVVVGAYFDGLGILGGSMYPGADSNASGVAVLLGLAEMLREMYAVGHTYDKSVIFVAFDGKTRDMAGSGAFFRIAERGALRDPVTGEAVTPDRIALMVNIDQVGSTMSPLPSGDPNYLIMLSDPRENFRTQLDRCNTRYLCALDLAYDYYGSEDFTRLFFRRVCDQRVFLEHGIPAVMFTSGITMHNNKPYDDPASLDFEVLKRRTDLIFYFLSRNL